jgi:aerobic-type carbon monoxide dehydrogenase small subunit (CoxS/CutS family)
MLQLKVNGATHRVDVEDETPLLWVLRDTIGLTGPKYGCGVGQCGACSVHLDGNLARSCQIPAASAVGKSITTIEGIAVNRDHPVLQAWIAESVPQCGYCQAGQVMAAVALLKRKPDPTDTDIDVSMTNICRCGTYTEIRSAIHRAAKAMKA